MRTMVARLAVAGALAAFAVPALPCEGMKQTHASASDTAEKAQKKEKAEKKQAEKKTAVASADSGAKK